MDNGYKLLAVNVLKQAVKDYENNYNRTAILRWVRDGNVWFDILDIEPDVFERKLKKGVKK